MALVRSMTLPQLGIGASYAIWGFRAAATGHSDCPTLMKGYERAFHEDGEYALHLMRELARIFGNKGRRRIVLAGPGCCAVTADELSIVAMLSAAQDKDDVRRNAHITWLMGKSGETRLGEIAEELTAIFQSIGMQIKPPPLELETFDSPKGSVMYAATGNA